MISREMFPLRNLQSLKNVTNVLLISILLMTTMFLIFPTTLLPTSSLVEENVEEGVEADEEIVGRIQLDLKTQNELIQGADHNITHCSLQIKFWAVTLWPYDVNGLKKAVQGVLANGWCVLVMDRTASDTATIANEVKNWNNPGIVHLTFESQQQLPFDIVKVAPKDGHLARKNIGYIYAMSEGAHTILDLDVDGVALGGIDFGSLEVLPMNLALGVYRRPNLEKEDLVYQTAPDGEVPWDPLVIPHQWNVSSFKDQKCKPIIQHYISLKAEKEFYHTRLQGSANSSRDLSTWMKMVMPRNVFAFYNAKATLYLKEAFWALLIPPHVHPLLSEKLRALVAQSLFHMQPDACVMVWYNINKDNSLHQSRKYIPGHFSKETQIISDAIRNLPLKETEFPDAFTRVYQVLQKQGLVSSFDIDFAQAWFDDLVGVNILWPAMPVKNNFMNKTQLCVMFNHKHVARITAREIAAKYLPFFNNVHLIVDSTPVSRLSLAPSILPAQKVSLEEVVSGFQTQFWPKELTYEPCLSYTGYQQHLCLHKCLKRAEGRPVLYMGDDTFLNLATANRTLPWDKIWFQPIGHQNATNPEDEASFDNNFKLWNHYDQLILASKVLKSLPMRMKADYLAHARQTGQVAGHAISDNVYVPGLFVGKLIKVLEAINKSAPVIFSEAAIPLAIKLLAPGCEKKVEFKPIVMLWHEDRYEVDVHELHLRHAMLLHPVKISVPGLRSMWRDAMAEQYKLFLRKG